MRLTLPQYRENLCTITFIGYTELVKEVYYYLEHKMFDFYILLLYIVNSTQCIE